MVFLTIVLLDVRRLEVLRVLDVVESPAQGLEAIRIIRKLCSASCVDDIPCVNDGNRLPLPCCARGCCCNLAEAQGLGLLVVGHPWGDGYSRLPDPLDFFDFVAPAVADDCGLGGTACLRYDYCSSP